MSEKNMNVAMETFISYRRSDGTDRIDHFRDFLQINNVHGFFDLDEPQKMNEQVLSPILVEHIECASNFVVFFSLASIKRLIRFCEGNHEDRDYVYLELDTAIKNNCIIIPVFYEDNIDMNEADRLAHKLFEECLQLDDSYSYILKDKNETDKELFRRIFDRMGKKRSVKRTDLSGYYWVGTRQSDMPVLGNGMGFKGAIFLFGDHDDEENNLYVMCAKDSAKRVDHNDAADLTQDEFVEEAVKKVLLKDQDAVFMFYNPSTIHRLHFCQKYGRRHFSCLNSEEILDLVNNKLSFRNLIKDIVPMLPVVERTRVDCDYYELLEAKERGEFEDRGDYGCDVPEIKYDEDTQFIIQAPVSSGGSGTFILNKENTDYLLSTLDKRAKYLVSVYHRHNIPVNMHVVIYDNEIHYLPGSIQLEREVKSENKLLYKGADFIAFQRIQFELRKQLEGQVIKVAEKLHEIGYRGVCGIDAIIHDGRVNILEVNGRFQASTELINYAVRKRNLKTVQELNVDAFEKQEHSPLRHIIESFRVPYSNFTYSYEGQALHDAWVCQKADNVKYVERIQKDGYIADPKRKYEAQAYLYRISFNKNIASVSEDGSVWINENICEPDKHMVRRIRSREKLAVKIALLIQGIVVDKSIKEDTKLREATNNAVDLQFGEGPSSMIINSPTEIRYVEFSPFELKKSPSRQGKYSIYYYGELLLDNIGIFPADQNQDMYLRDGRHRYSEIAYLSTDRLRVHLTNACCFKLRSVDGQCQECKFCNIPVIDTPYPIEPEDVREVVSTYMAQRDEQKEANPEAVVLRHFLIGGQSLQGGSRKLIEVADVLKDFEGAKYAMTLPLKEEIVRELVKKGVYEYAYNIEIFNEACRKKYMPGKSEISVSEYMDALIMTRQIVGAVRIHQDRKAVRSMIIVGLEPWDDMINGVRMLIENRIEPMLSVFRPLPGTPLEDLNAPPMKDVYKLFFTVSNMLFESGATSGNSFRKLGPKCPCCQNNTVSLPWHYQVGTTVKTSWGMDPEQLNFEM